RRCLPRVDRRAEPRREARCRDRGHGIPAVRDDPGLPRLPADLARCEARGARDRSARPEEPGEDASRQEQGGRRRLTSPLQIQGKIGQERRRSRIVLLPAPTLFFGRCTMRLSLISAVAAGAVALGGCAYGDFGVGLGYGDYGYGYSPYYGYGNSGYGYGPYCG